MVRLEGEERPGVRGARAGAARAIDEERTEVPLPFAHRRDVGLPLVSLALDPLPTGDASAAAQDDSLVRVGSDSEGSLRAHAGVVRRQDQRIVQLVGPGAQQESDTLPRSTGFLAGLTRRLDCGGQ